MKKEKTAISPTREEDYPAWYQQVIRSADLAENSPVRGCMVIKPWGYGIWENIQTVLNKMFKDTGHENAYFPLFIPKSFLEKEAKHVAGFAKECAVVTHHRLEDDGKGGLRPAGELEEPLIVRPTSETIIGAMFSKWTNSYRDLPLLINQWANVVRWEMRTRLFLRTTEFLWQEGHTAHATEKEAMQETLQMLNIYQKFAQDYMAMPVITGEKTETERFPGALSTYSIEAMMQDGKALQAGTSHFLGQNFAKASNIKFLSDQGKEELAWTTSWGVSTRLIGGLIMTHSDDNGLVLPPRLAPSHIAIIPIIHKEADRDDIMNYCFTLKDELGAQTYDGAPLRVILDASHHNPGEKSWIWVKKGVPLRIEIGPRDIKENAVFVARRDKGVREKTSMPRDEFIQTAAAILQDIQTSLFKKATDFRTQRMQKIENKADLYAYFKPSKKENQTDLGFAQCFWNGSTAVEEQLKSDLNVTIRCIPLEQSGEEGTCVMTGEKCNVQAILAKAY